MEDYQKRVIEEKSDLDEKIKRLEEFVNADSFSELSSSEQGLIMVQHEAMHHYSGVLERRIELFL